MGFSDLFRVVCEFVFSSSTDMAPVAEEFAIPTFEHIRDALLYDFRNLDSLQRLQWKQYETPVIENVNPETIFDMLGLDDDNFWNHHGNTKEDYLEIASHLPEIQERLANGESLSDIGKDPVLDKTIRAYYDEDNMVKVSKYKDGYQSRGDGRHRVMAAEELGYDMPVKVIEEISDIEEEEEQTVETKVDVKVEVKEKEKITETEEGVTVETETEVTQTTNIETTEYENDGIDY